MHTRSASRASNVLRLLGVISVPHGLMTLYIARFASATVRCERCDTISQKNACFSMCLDCAAQKKRCDTDIKDTLSVELLG